MNQSEIEQSLSNLIEGIGITPGKEKIMLQGSREERIEEMESLASAEWNLETFLALHTGFEDHAFQVRWASLDALIKIAEKKPQPIPISPALLLSYYMFHVTVSSGYTPRIFRLFVKLDTPETNRIIERCIKEVKRNEDFEYFLEILKENDKLELLGDCEEGLSKGKIKILRKVLSTNSSRQG